MFAFHISVRHANEYMISPTKMELDLAPGESRGYWKYHTPGKWFKQAKAMGKINNEKATFLFDSVAEVSIVDTPFLVRLDVSSTRVRGKRVWGSVRMYTRLWDELRSRSR